MLLSCPTCASGLQVPDGTTAHVRCPACKLVFPAAAGLTPAEPAPPPPPPRPRPTPAPRREPQADPTANRDFDPPADVEKPRPTKRRDDGKFTPEERAVLKGQFIRGMWGCRLVSGAYSLQAVGLLFVVLQMALAAFHVQTLLLLAIAALCGVANLVLLPIGLGLILASRPASGLYRFGIPAAVAVCVHAVFVLAVVLRTHPEQVIGGDVVPAGQIVMVELVTKLNALTTYLLLAFYPDVTQFIPAAFVLDLLCGLAELVRLILVILTLTGVARATGDKELVYRSVRAAGIGSLGPAGLAVLMPVYVALTFVAAQMFSAMAGMLLLVVGVMGIYAILAGALVPSAVAARDAAEACEFPYQSQNFEIGD